VYILVRGFDNVFKGLETRNQNRKAIEQIKASVSRVRRPPSPPPAAPPRDFPEELYSPEAADLPSDVLEAIATIYLMRRHFVEGSTLSSSAMGRAPGEGIEASRGFFLKKLREGVDAISDEEYAMLPPDLRQEVNKGIALLKRYTGYNTSSTANTRPKEQSSPQNPFRQIIQELRESQTTLSGPPKNKLSYTKKRLLLFIGFLTLVFIVFLISFIPLISMQ
jgi:hypothetical protein